MGPSATYGTLSYQYIFFTFRVEIIASSCYTFDSRRSWLPFLCERGVSRMSLYEKLSLLIALATLIATVLKK